MHSLFEACAPGDGQARVHSIGLVIRLGAAVALLGATGACGGGGSAPAPPPPPTAPSGPLAAVMWVPDPVGYDADRLAGFNRLNEIRLSAGLGMLAQNRLMDQAAQAHADWEIANDVYGHVEQPGTTAFTGAHWYDRDAALGYAPLAGGEVETSSYGASDAVDLLVNVVYHRAILLAIDSVDVGVGRSNQLASNVSEPLVLDIAVPGNDLLRSLGQRPQDFTQGVVIWPVDGAQAVQTHMGGEFPDPVPDSDVLALGMPASVTVSNSRILFVTSFSLRKASTGEVVPTRLLTNANDPNGLIPASYAAVIPLAALSPATAFEVDFEGAVLDSDTNVSTALSRIWTFVTRSS